MRRLLLLLLLPVIVFGYSYSIDPASVVLAPSLGYVVPSLGEGVYPTEAGLPALPEIPLQIFVPGGGRAVEVTIERMETREIPGVWAVMPINEPRPISRPEEYSATPNPEIYNSTEPYPSTPLRAIGGGNLAGYGIAEVGFNPFIYEPAVGRLTLITHIEFSIVTEPLDYRTVTPSRQTQRVADAYLERVQGLVINPEEVYHQTTIVEPAQYMSSGIPDYGSTAEWVIIVDKSMESQANTLRNWKLRKGLTTAVVTTEHIYANYSGRDNPERIRNFIIHAFENWSTEWIVLAGDTNVMPERRGYVVISGTSQDDRLIPTDLYFADLDGCWNPNDNNYWGEVSDNPDMYSDVYVTRLPAQNLAHLAIMVNKTLTYEKNIPDNFVTRALWLGARLDWNPTWGGDCKEVVLPYLPSQFNVTKLYEKFGNISRNAVITHINAGNAAVVNHAAHSDYDLIGTGPDNMFSSHAAALTNGDKAGWMYSIGCNPGGFDRNTCFGEALLRNNNGGMVAVIMNSRYGWYIPGWAGGGPSDRLDQAFFNSMFTKHYYNFGKAVADMRDTYVPSARTDVYYRWCVYENNVLGPSETASYSNTVADLSASHTDTYTGGPVTVTVTSGGNPVNGALVCLYKDGEVHVTANTNSSGVATFSGLNVETDGTIMVTATAHNYRPYEGSMYCPNADIDVAYFTGDLRDQGVVLSWMVEDTGELLELHLIRNESRLTDRPLSAQGSFLDRAPVGEQVYYLEMLTVDGASLRYGPLSVIVEDVTRQVFSLSDAYPNPSTGLFNLQVELSESTACELAIYDLAGRRVATIHEGELAAGRHVLSWDGSGTPAGVYIAHLTADGRVLTRRLALVR